MGSGDKRNGKRFHLRFVVESGLAREGGGSVNINVGWADAIGSKPPPTGPPRHRLKRLVQDALQRYLASIC